MSNHIELAEAVGNLDSIKGDIKFQDGKIAIRGKDKEHWYVCDVGFRVGGNGDRRFHWN